MKNWRSVKVLLTGLLVGAVCAVAVADAPPPPNILLWNSGGGSDFAKPPARWGNGDFRVSRQVTFDTLETLQVTTRNLREGVRFDLKNPMDIAPYMDKGFLRLRVQFHSNQRNQGGMGPGDPGAAPGGFGGRGRGGFGGGGFGGGGFGGGGGFAPAAPLMQPRTQSAAQALPPFGGGGVPGDFNPVPQGPPRETTEIDHLMVTLVLDKGIMSTVIDIPKRRGSETDVDTRRAHADDNGWMLFVVPLKSLQTTPGATGNLQRVILTSDNEDTYNVSQLGIVISSDKMTVSIRRQSDPLGTQQGEITVKPGRLTLVADVEPGDGDPQVTWSFDADNKNAPQAAAQQAPGFDGMPPDGGAPAPTGPSVDARGLVATHNYPNQEQNYRVEVTVHDRTGKNPDVKASLLVKVRNGN
jgi:hypothetical protein